MPDWQKYGLMSGKNSTLASIQVIFTKKAKISVCKKPKKTHPEHLMQPEVFGSDLWPRHLFTSLAWKPGA